MAPSREDSAAGPARGAPLAVAGAILIGLALPLLISGRATTAVAVLLGLILVIAAPGRRAVLVAAWQGLRAPFAIAVAAMLLLWLPSVVDSVDPMRSFGVWARDLGMIAAAALIYHALRARPSTAQAALRAMIGSALFCGLIALASIFVAGELWSLVHGDGWVAIDARKYLKSYGSLAACLVPVVIWAGFQLGGRWRIAALLYVPLGILLIVSLNSRAGMVGLALAVLVGGASVVSARTRYPWMPLAGVGMAIIAVLGVVLWRLPGFPPGAAIEAGQYAGPVPDTLPVLDVHRQTIWAFGRDRFVEAPWFGHGLDVSNYLPGANTIAPGIGGLQQFLPGHPHNWLLELLIDAGAIGTAAALAVLAALTAAIARLPRATQPYGFALFAAFWGSSIFNFSIWSAWWQLVFLVLMALVLGTARTETKRA